MKGTGVLAFLAFSCLFCSVQAESQRGLMIIPVQEHGTQKQVELYNHSYALVIGNDKYADPAWPVLSNAVNDAEAVAAELKKRGFEVTLLKNLASKQLEESLEDFVYMTDEDRSARLFIWYAGHGHTVNGEGYLVPTDAPNPEGKTARRFRRDALSMRRFGEYMREAQSRHVMAVFDSCFSGTVFSSARDKPPSVVNRAVTHKVRQFISSGGERQTVRDDGMFRRLFLDAITGSDPRADANGDGYILGSELGLYLHQQMVNLTEGSQTPRSGKLKALGFDIGDFVFKTGQNKLDKTIQSSPAFSNDDDKELTEELKRRISKLEALINSPTSSDNTPQIKTNIDVLRKSPPKSRIFSLLTTGLSGVVTEGSQRYSINLYKKNDTIHVEYPELRCGGVWLRMEQTDYTASFVEKIKYGTSRCLNNGKAKLIFEEKDIVRFEWRKRNSNRLVASSILRP